MSETPETSPAPSSGRDLRERLAERRSKGGSEKPTPADTGHSFTVLQKGRSYIDALVFAFVLAMFIRTFVFELFMIPTGSMTPTLIGDSAGEVVFLDYDGDGVEDVVYTRRRGPRTFDNTLQIYLMNKDGTYRQQLYVDRLPPGLADQIGVKSPARTDMIIVSKFAYWFRSPNRGEIAVFKVPDRPDPTRSGASTFDPRKPVYIKRVMGLGGETVEFLPVAARDVPAGDPRRVSTKLGGIEYHITPKPLLVNGQPLTDPFLNGIAHFPRPVVGAPRATDEPNVIEVPKDSVLMIGDNAQSSSDGRYWGAVPEVLLRGKAVLRYKPFNAARFLR